MITARQQERRTRAPRRTVTRVRRTAGAVTPRLDGEWRVIRVSGFLPPFVTKSIGPHSGWTFWFGVPVAKFIRSGLTLRYRLWPVVDELRRSGHGFLGRGLVFGREFCRFRLERR